MRYNLIWRGFKNIRGLDKKKRTQKMKSNKSLFKSCKKFSHLTSNKTLKMQFSNPASFQKRKKSRIHTKWQWMNHLITWWSILQPTFYLCLFWVHPIYSKYTINLVLVLSILISSFNSLLKLISRVKSKQLNLEYDTFNMLNLIWPLNELIPTKKAQFLAIKRSYWYYVTNPIEILMTCFNNSVLLISELCH